MNVPATHKPALEITVHVADGRQVRFVQTDEDLAKSLLERLQPSKLFSNELLLIGGDAAMDTFPTRSITRVDLVSDLLGTYPHPMSITAVEEITEAEFNERRTWADAARPPLSGQTNIIVYQIIALSTGHKLHLEIHIVRPLSGIPASAIRTTLDRPGYAHLIFSTHGVHAAKQGGGLIVLNPRHITQLTFLPGPPVVPAGVWHAEAVPEEITRITI